MSQQSLFPSQNVLSPYLRFGCLSARLFYWKLRELYRKVYALFIYSKHWEINSLILILRSVFSVSVLQIFDPEVCEITNKL